MEKRVVTNTHNLSIIFGFRLFLKDTIYWFEIFL